MNDWLENSACSDIYTNTLIDFYLVFEYSLTKCSLIHYYLYILFSKRQINKNIVIGYVYNGHPFDFYGLWKFWINDPHMGNCPKLYRSLNLIFTLQIFVWDVNITPGPKCSNCQTPTVITLFSSPNKYRLAFTVTFEYIILQGLGVAQVAVTESWR